MPTVTSLSQYQLFNNGPLTTTFTAPATCATETTVVQIALTEYLNTPSFLDDCEQDAIGDCFPSGAAMDKRYSPIQSLPTRNFHIDYFSPGVFCPDTWTTAGLAVKDEAGAVVTTSGVFKPHIEDGSYKNIFGNRIPNIFLEGLGPGETAVLCCPSNFVPGPETGCYSALPSYKITGGCVRVYPDDSFTTVNATYTYNGTVVTTEAVSLVGSSPLTTQPITFLATDSSGYVGVTSVMMATLVYRAADVPSRTTSGQTVILGPTTSSSASRIHTKTQGNSPAAMMVVWFVATLAGMILAVPM